MRKTFVLTLGLLALGALACSSLAGLIPGGDDDGGQEPAGPQSGSEVLFSDDFSDTSTGWEQGDYGTGSVGYKSGTYSVVSNGEGETMWGLAFRNFSDTIVAVDATQISAPDNDNNDYGVMCRVQSNSDGYFLLISGDGYYSILLRSDESFTPLVDWTQTETINLGDARNQIVATCDGETFSLTVNGDLLASVEDSTFSRGDLALTATSYESTPTEVHFDNLRVTAP